jgi:hypothetical protein
MWCGTSYAEAVVQDLAEVMSGDQEVCDVGAAAYAVHWVETGGRRHPAPAIGAAGTVR